MTTYRALDFEFVVQVDDPALRDYVATVFDGLVVDDGSTEALQVIRVTAAEDESESRFDLRHDDSELGTGLTAPAAVDAIVQRVNSRCVDSSEWLSTHASCVSRDGHAILFAAHSESGKSTLAAGLVRAGFAYVTDEAVAFDWDGGCIQPYPKPISLDPGSWPLFPELDPRATYAGDAAFSQWHVPATHVGPGRVSAPCRARWLVFPQYEAGADTAFTPITRGEALVEWSKNTFRFNEHGRRALELLGGLVPDVECYRMTVGDLDDAVACVGELVGVSSGLTGVDAPVRRTDVYSVEVDGEAVLLQETDDQLHRLNVTAALVWFLLDGVTTLEAIAHDISEELELPYAQVLDDTVRIANQLRAQQLVQRP